MDAWKMLTAIVSFSVSLAGVFLTIRLATRYGVLDIPNKRSSHTVPKPRGGGIGILLGICASGIMCFALGYAVPPWPFWVGLILMAIIGFLDDIWGGLHVILRIFAQLLAGLIAAIFLGHFESLPLPGPFNVSLGFLGYIATILWIIIVINFFNFMDGIDGIAGMQALVSGLALAVAGIGTASFIGSAVVGATAAFLLFNWEPSKIFLGDTGSYSLGFIFSVAPLLDKGRGAYSLAMLVGISLWLFLSDASITLLRRVLEGERFWEAHRDHYYQRLVKCGLSHSQVALSLGFAMFAVTFLPVIAHTSGRMSVWWASFCVACVATVVEMAFTRHFERRP